MREPIFNAPIAICLSVLIAIMAALTWALRWLSDQMDFSSFMLFCVVTFAIMVACGFGWDRYAARRHKPSRQ